MIHKTSRKNYILATLGGYLLPFVVALSITLLFDVFTNVNTELYGIITIMPFMMGLLALPVIIASGFVGYPVFKYCLNKLNKVSFSSLYLSATASSFASAATALITANVYCLITDVNYTLTDIAEMPVNDYLVTFVFFTPFILLFTLFATAVYIVRYVKDEDCGTE